MPRPLVILGTGGGVYDLLDVVDAINAERPTWELIGFLDDSRPAGGVHLGLEILGGLRDAPRFAEAAFANAIGGDKTFRRLPGILASTGAAHDRFATLVHPAASISPRARLGRGVIANPGVVIAGGVAIGDHVTLCPGCIIGHESSIGDYCILAPGSTISGLVRVEPTCYIGARAAIRQKLRIGTGALVGMGAVVVKDVPPGTTVVGNPAQRLIRGDRPSMTPAAREALVHSGYEPATEETRPRHTGLGHAASARL
jgi:sugar O-acyltransferase (sialic acid O-acetyltransferase NeuD family)